MRLQNKTFIFTTSSNDATQSDFSKSFVKINNKLTDIKLFDLFYGIKNQRKNTIKSYSILEFVDELGNIEINEKVYNISFAGDNDEFILSKSYDPLIFILNDKNISNDEIALLEKRIIDSAPVDVQEQPLEQKTEALETPEAGAHIKLFTNSDYEQEKEDLKQDGFVEYNTFPTSNVKLLVNEKILETDVDDEQDEKIVLIEIESNDSFAILIRDEYEIKLNTNDKTFTYEKIGE